MILKIYTIVEIILYSAWIRISFFLKERHSLPSCRIYNQADSIGAESRAGKDTYEIEANLYHCTGVFIWL